MDETEREERAAQEQLRLVKFAHDRDQVFRHQAQRRERRRISCTLCECKFCSNAGKQCTKEASLKTPRDWKDHNELDLCNECYYSAECDQMELPTCSQETFDMSLALENSVGIWQHWRKVKQVHSGCLPDVKIRKKQCIYCDCDGCRSTMAAPGEGVRQDRKVTTGLRKRRKRVKKMHKQRQFEEEHAKGMVPRDRKCQCLVGPCDGMATKAINPSGERPRWPMSLTVRDDGHDWNCKLWLCDECYEGEIQSRNAARRVREIWHSSTLRRVVRQPASALTREIAWGANAVSADHIDRIRDRYNMAGDEVPSEEEWMHRCLACKCDGCVRGFTMQQAAPPTRDPLERPWPTRVSRVDIGGEESSDDAC